jgi:integrase/recombinase XerD
VAAGATVLAEAVQSYLSMRRAIGFKLISEGQRLQSFARFSDMRGRYYVCNEIAIEWAALARSLPERARRLGDVIRFSRYIRAEDERHQLPPRAFGSENRPRPVPYIFSRAEVRRALQAASQLSCADSFSRHTYSTLFGLLACTGLRISEALRLRLADISDDGLVIRCSKFRKSRLVPLHQSVQIELERYLRRRCAHAPYEDHVFVSRRKRPIRLQEVERVFHSIVQKIGLPRGPGLPRPLIHSLRHTFAVRALERCPDDHNRITQHMLALSTYLGHCKVAHTYWYLEATPHLMQNIAERVERFVSQRSRP